MQYVTLQEGSKLTGKSEMTIRRLTKKPGGKVNTKSEDGRLFISLEYLYKHYPPIVAQPAPEPVQEPTQKPIQEAEHLPKQTDQDSTAVNTAMQALISQLEAKDMQIASLMERLKESNINTNRLLQQNNPEPEPTRKEEPTTRRNTGTIITTGIVVILVVIIVLLVVWIVTNQNTI